MRMTWHDHVICFIPEGDKDILDVGIMLGRINGKVVWVQDVNYGKLASVEVSPLALLEYVVSEREITTRRQW